MLKGMCVALGAASLLLAAGAVRADTVKVTGVHNCCGSCVKGINKALTDAGATNIMLAKSDLSFETSDAPKAIEALYDAGYAGKLEGGKEPRRGTRGVQGKTLKASKVHNCCGGCTAAINKALKDKGKTDAKGGTTTFTITSDSDLRGRDVVDALRAQGFNAKIENGQ